MLSKSCIQVIPEGTPIKGILKRKDMREYPGSETANEENKLIVKHLPKKKKKKNKKKRKDKKRSDSDSTSRSSASINTNAEESNEPNNRHSRSRTTPSPRRRECDIHNLQPAVAEHSPGLSVENDLSSY